MVATKRIQAPRIGQFLGLIVYVHYGLFTLLPDSHSLMVSWPWVLIAEAGLAYGVLWTLWQLCSGQLTGLGGGLDWIVGLGFVSLGLAIAVAKFPQTAFWYGLLALPYFLILYGLKAHLSSVTSAEPRQSPQSSALKLSQIRRQNLFTGQGVLSLTFILISLGLWSIKTVVPELERLSQLRASGIRADFSFTNLYLRNWAPFGHPNYVAGYLLLALPVLMALAITQTGWRRWIWSLGCGLGLLDLYTTSSRGGWLGLTVMVGVGVGLLRRSSVSRRWIGLGTVIATAGLVMIALQNQRLRETLTGIFSLQGSGELAFRWITTCTGWRMGLAQPLVGLGPGSVPILYQRYRPGWAGQEAEMVFQLHSTPVQVWAELGGLGVLALGVGLGVIAYLLRDLLRSRVWENLEPSDRAFTGAMIAGWSGYAVLALTDYQLDNPAIAGFLVLELAAIAAIRHDYIQLTPPLSQRQQQIALGYIGLILGIAILWLIPVNRAWALSHQGFSVLHRRPPALNQFVDRLDHAHRLTPWEPYYSYQLGWNLGELVTLNPNPVVIKNLLPQAIFWFQTAIKHSPALEFGRSNLGWLLLDNQPKAAAQEFSQAIKLIPAKRSLFYGLGQSWLAQQQIDQGLAAIALEWVRHPPVFSSPQWQQSAWQQFLPGLRQRSETLYTDLLNQTSLNTPGSQWLYQSRGMLRWWGGNRQGAETDFQACEFLPGQILLALDAPVSKGPLSLSNPQKVALEQAIALNQPWALAIAAWQQPEQREALLRRGLLAGDQGADLALLPELLKTMNASTSLRQWLQEKAPGRPSRTQRVGFGVLSRHIDGPAPQDFGISVENVAIAAYFSNFWADPVYDPALDQALQPFRQAVLAP